jgi:hypothetical protein
VLRLTWQARTTLLCGAITPLTAGLIVGLWIYLPQWEHSAERTTLIGIVTTVVGLALPLAFIFGVLPALIGGALYSAALTLVPFAETRIILRALLAAALAGLVGGLWCQIVLGFPAVGYGVVAAISGFLFALRWPRRLQAAPSNPRLERP